MAAAPTSIQQARVVEGAAPHITTHPYIGILGVFLGALTATLNGRLLSVGLADVRGAMGLGFDEASWLPTMLNAGMMFIGVFCVFLGAVYGIRRVLLVSGAAFTIISLAIPFAGDVHTMQVLELLAGLASGSFYSLTLTFVARNLPPKLLIFGVAAYALDIIVTSNLGALIEGTLVESLSWHWIFWVPAVLAPIVMTCVHFGMKTEEASSPRPSWRGLFYTSLGFSLIYAALDQGERLNWTSSGLIVGLFAGGAAFLIAALVRRAIQPNPIVNLPFLNARNVVILALGIFCIRFSLLSSLLVIPGFLGSIAQYRPLETGHALAWVAAPQFLLVWIVAISVVFISPRIIMAAGFATIALTCWAVAHFDSSWAGESFFKLELILAVGIGGAFVALVVNLLLLALEMGAISSVANAATFSAAMHTMRLLGGEIGAVSLGRFLSHREQWHSNVLGQYVDAGNWMTAERLQALTAGMLPFSGGGEEAQAKAAGLLGLQVRAQAYTLASADTLLAIAWVIAAYLFLLLLLKPSTIDLRHAGKPR